MSITSSNTQRWPTPLDINLFNCRSNNLKYIIEGGKGRNHKEKKEAMLVHVSTGLEEMEGARRAT